MKKLAFVVAFISFVLHAQSQETWQTDFSVNSSNVFFSRGTVWLTGNQMVCLVRSLHCYHYAAVHGPAAPGSNAPPTFPLSLDDCPPNSFDYNQGMFWLTDEQVGQLRAGLWYLLLDDIRVPIVLDRICRYRATNTVEFTARIVGENPAHQSPWELRFGRARCGLTGDNFSYEITMPASFAPYRAYIQIFNDSAFYHPIIVDFGTLDCVAPSSTNHPPDASDLELLPTCVMRGAVCAPKDLVPALLEGRWLLRIGTINLAPLNYGFITPVDSDKDGVPDYLDHCQATATNSVVNTNGCSIADLCPCDGPWKDHGEYLRCLMKTTKAFLADGLITAAQCRALLRQAIHSDCGKKKPHRLPSR